MKSLAIALAATSLLAATGSAPAALVDRGGGMIYDTTRNITWLADMNYAQTGGYDADGLMTWAAARQWADTLVFGGYDDWRLPTLDPADTSCSASLPAAGGHPQQYYGYGCTGGELSGLFVTDLGNKTQSVLNQVGDTAEQIANLALFGNVQPTVYWSDTEYAPIPGLAWHFNAGFGYQNVGSNDFEFRAIAVRAGDSVSQVPAPPSLALSLLGLLGLACAQRSRSR